METVTISPIEQYVIDRVREMRIARKISQRELADLLEMTHGFVGMVESPKKRAKYNLNHIAEFARIFNCSPREFLPENL